MDGPRPSRCCCAMVGSASADGVLAGVQLHNTHHVPILVQLGCAGGSSRGVWRGALHLQLREGEPLKQSRGAQSPPNFPARLSRSMVRVWQGLVGFMGPCV